MLEYKGTQIIMQKHVLMLNVSDVMQQNSKANPCVFQMQSLSIKPSNHQQQQQVHLYKVHGKLVQSYRLPLQVFACFWILHLTMLLGS